MPQRNKVTYSKDLDMTYIMSPDGKTPIGSMDGDQTDNPLVYDPKVAELQMQNVTPPSTAQTGPQKIAQMGKDLAVNAASQAPLMIPGMGPILGPAIRVAASLGAGYLADRSINNGQHSPYESATQAALNTGVGTAIPWLLERSPNFRAPGIRSQSTTETTADPTVSERSSTGTREGVSTGIGTNTSTGSSTVSSSGTSAREAISTGESSNEGLTSGTSGRTTTTQHFNEELPPSDAMLAVQKEINRLKNIDTSKFNAGAMSQLNAAIDRNQSALEHLTEANINSGIVSKSSGTNEGYTVGSSKSSNVSSSKGTSSSTSSGTSQNSGTSQRSGTTSGTSQTEGTTTTQPGKTIRVTNSFSSGHTWIERLADSIDFTKLPVTRQQEFVNHLKAIGVNTTIDAINDALSK